MTLESWKSRAFGGADCLTSDENEGKMNKNYPAISVTSIQFLHPFKTVCCVNHALRKAQVWVGHKLKFSFKIPKNLHIIGNFSLDRPQTPQNSDITNQNGVNNLTWSPGTRDHGVSKFSERRGAHVYYTYTLISLLKLLISGQPAASSWTKFCYTHTPSEPSRLRYWEYSAPLRD